MAMMNCPKCNEEISNKATKCVHCGFSLVEEKMITCSECGKEISSKKKICPNCGCPVVEKEKNDDTQKVELTKVAFGKNTKQVLLFAGIGVIILIVAILLIGSANSKSYKKDLDTVIVKMLDGGVIAEECGNLTKKVWYNTIYEENDYTTNKYTKDSYGYFYDDFNTSLNILFNSSDFKEKIESIKSNQEEVANLMKKLKNPPSEWEEAYDDLKDYYDSYLELTNLAISPTGSLTTFSSKFNDADNKMSNSYSKMKNYINN
ncbi:MAG: zinc ribbon domain-containing protein [Bacilli bacterium]|nr:zinc ribbon domain-containing protein [Bacilli bacterium]